MTKLITVTGRPGAGKTTVASILAEKLSKKHTVCLIDNNKNNINIYDVVSPIENINLYACLADKESCRKAIKESAAELRKNLYFFSGGNELLTEEQIQMLKELNIFEYIIIDSGTTKMEYPDYNIIVVNQNSAEYTVIDEYITVSNCLRASNNLIVVNRYTEDAEFKVKKDFKLYYCPEIVNFANGYELRLPEKNTSEVKKIIEAITGDKSEVKMKPRFGLFGRR
ncbi:DUF2075 domain-containing protein [Sedimentibacter sp. MB35-C1]|uniref:DNA/RNA helicase domain-containing protein n=1 Tax=Sedimentibacter sp. MB35-C1 TaxID=3070995 RepID=UPI0027E175A2|nr:DNA/RNA helicase domain-containing protein [Sedimentibacter sp. MB35-C1]WMJ77875.1 DUF2075 domain-containing protein [Sedimentibacter sp. MB35-C1]